MKVFNNLSRRIEDFIPLHSDRVFIYSCGPTVYDLSHVGHARSCLVWDMVYRYLRFRKYNPIWIRNITNIDDKIVKRALEQSLSPDALSRIYTYEFWADMKALNISTPEHEPRATDFLPEMFEFIQELIACNSAYVINGDVYFRVNSHHNYGQMKGLSLDQLREGQARIELDSSKEDRLDFALWKAFPDQVSTSFLSPWGWGRPGWHLECSAMIRSLLLKHNAGATLDIHAGGDDLIHPHHENECAQSEVLSGQALAKYWLHNGMVMINGSKMSKSEGNFLTIRDLLALYKPNTIRYFALSTHYKKQINFSHEALQAAEQGLNKLLESLKPSLEEYLGGAAKHDHLDNNLITEFTNIMDEDFASPQALALIFSSFHENPKLAPTILYLLEILGFDIQVIKNNSNLSHHTDKVLAELMNLILELRSEARNAKDFQTSDKIRNALTAAGIKVQDYRDKPSQWSL